MPGYVGLPPEGSVGGAWGAGMYPPWFLDAMQENGIADPYQAANIFRQYVQDNPDTDFGWYWNSFHPGAEMSGAVFGDPNATPDPGGQPEQPQPDPRPTVTPRPHNPNPRYQPPSRSGPVDNRQPRDPNWTPWGPLHPTPSATPPPNPANLPPPPPADPGADPYIRENNGPIGGPSVHPVPTSPAPTFTPTGPGPRPAKPGAVPNPGGLGPPQPADTPPPTAASLTSNASPQQPPLIIGQGDAQKKRVKPVNGTGTAYNNTARRA